MCANCSASPTKIHTHATHLFTSPRGHDDVGNELIQAPKTGPHAPPHQVSQEEGEGRLGRKIGDEKIAVQEEGAERERGKVGGVKVFY